MCYHFGLSEQSKARMEAVGRVELDPSFSRVLARTKVVHAVLVPVTAIAGGIWVGRNGGGPAMWLQFLPWMIGGIVEAFRPDSLGNDIAKQAVQVLFSSLAGFIIFYLPFFVFPTGID